MESYTSQNIIICVSKLKESYIKYFIIFNVTILIKSNYIR